METNSSKNLRKNTLGGFKWGVIDRGGNVVVQFVIGIILARLLPTEDFGLIGLAMIVVAFSQVFVDLGLGPALIQRQGINEKHIRSCFTISGGLGLVAAILVYFTAPFLAHLLGSERMIPILQALSIIFVLKGLEITSVSLLKKELAFKKIFFVNISKLVLYGVVTITLALQGFGVWSLVIGNIIKQSLSFILNYIFVRHKVVPSLPKKELKDLSYFGTGMTITKVFNYFALKGDFFLVGRLLGAKELGFYSRAYTLMQMPTTQFVSILSNVLFPAASVIQHDTERSKRVFEKAIKILAFVLIPVCLAMVILAPDLIIGLYGKKWLPAVLPFQILGVVGFLRGTYNAAATFLRAKGLIYKVLFCNVCYGISMVITVWAGTKVYGILGASMAVSFSIVIMWLLVMYFNSKMLNTKMLHLIKLYLPGLLIGLLSCILLYFSRILVMHVVTSHILILSITGVLFIIFLLFSFWVIPGKFLNDIPSIMIEVIQDIKMKKKIKKRIINLLNKKVV